MGQADDSSSVFLGQAGFFVSLTEAIKYDATDQDYLFAGGMGLFRMASVSRIGSKNAFQFGENRAFPVPKVNCLRLALHLI